MMQDKQTKKELRQILKVLDGYRITIPSEVREKLGIDVGDYVIAQIEDTSWKVLPAEIHPRTP
ncbi:AbrB/MazE/SpoVT family DNA-binding domain-containing protein [candidate division NPL-UPA2 bacterium]|nr:AbrB/MazE/SpoVT family DNA-binding domain-containing protein [candidate division NPL-UPA2 bacterium]